MHGIHGFYRRLFGGLVLVLTVGTLKADTYTQSGNIPGWVGTFNGTVIYTIDEDLQTGDATLTVNATSGEEEGNPPTPKDVRLLLSHAGGGGALSTGQTFSQPIGTEIDIAIWINHGGWQTLGVAKTIIMGGSAYYRVPYNYTNGTTWDGELRFYKLVNGSPEENVSHTVTVSSGETVVGSWLANDGPNQYLATIAYEGVGEEPGLGWIVQDGLVTEPEIGIISDVEVDTPSEEVPPEDMPVNEATPTNEDTPTAPPSGASIATGTTTGDTEVTLRTSSDPSQGLTEGVFENAIGQVIRAVRQSGGGGGSTSVNVDVDTDGIESRIDDTNTELQAVNTSLGEIGLSLDALEDRAIAEQERADEEQQLRDDQLTELELEAAGQSAADQISALMPDADGLGPASEVQGAAIDFTVSLPATMGNASFDLNPFRADRLGPAIDWFRAAVAWLAIVLYGIWIFKEARVLFVDMTGARQARGNPVFGGTGGQLTAQLAAAAITAALAVTIVVVVGWHFGDIGFDYVVTAASSNPLTGMPAKAAWMLNKVFPVATLITVLVGRIGFHAACMQAHAIVSSIVRHFTS